MVSLLSASMGVSEFERGRIGIDLIILREIRDLNRSPNRPQRLLVCRRFHGLEAAPRSMCAPGGRANSCRSVYAMTIQIVKTRTAASNISCSRALTEFTVQLGNSARSAVIATALDA